MNKAMDQESKQVDITVEWQGAKHTESMDSEAVNKEALTGLVKRSFGGLPAKFKLERRSKKFKGYVPLRTKEDYKYLKRSLAVKNTLVLRVVVDAGVEAATAASQKTPKVVEPAQGSVDTKEPVAIAPKKKDILGKVEKSKKPDTYVSVPKDGFERLCKEIANLSAKLDKVVEKEESIKNHEHADGLNHHGESTITVGYHDSVYCDGCSFPCTERTRISGYRYSCKVCPDFDLCEKCYRDQDTVTWSCGVNHSKSHEMARTSPVSFSTLKTNKSAGELVRFHPGVFCDVCCPIGDPEHAIVGNRYKCKQCFNYDLCETCYSEGRSSGYHSACHEVVKYPAFVEVQLAGSLTEAATNESKVDEVKKDLEEQNEILQAQLKSLEDITDKYSSLIGLAKGYNIEELVKIGLKHVGRKEKSSNPSIKITSLVQGDFLQFVVANLSSRPTLANSMLELRSVSSSPTTIKFCIRNPIQSDCVIKLKTRIADLNDSPSNFLKKCSVKMLSEDGELILSGEFKDSQSIILVQVANEDLHPPQECLQDVLNTPESSIALEKKATKSVEETNTSISTLKEKAENGSDTNSLDPEADLGDTIVLSLDEFSRVLTLEDTDDDYSTLEDYEILSTDDYISEDQSTV